MNTEKQNFMARWGVEGMPADKQRLANAAWDECAKVHTEKFSKKLFQINTGLDEFKTACNVSVYLLDKQNVELRKQVQELQEYGAKLREAVSVFCGVGRLFIEGNKKVPEQFFYELESVVEELQRDC